MCVWFCMYVSHTIVLVSAVHAKLNPGQLHSRYVETLSATNHLSLAKQTFSTLPS